MTSCLIYLLLLVYLYGWKWVKTRHCGVRSSYIYAVISLFMVYVLLLYVCWFINRNKCIRDSPPNPSGCSLLLFPIRFSSPSPHLLVLSESGTSDFGEQHSSVNGRKKKPRANRQHTTQQTDSEIRPCARLHVMHEQFVGTCCFACWYR